MIEFQNLLNQVQVHGPPDQGVETADSKWARTLRPGTMNYLFGKIGDAQVGPLYLGGLGIVSIIFGFAAVEIIGLNMLASVDWNLMEFIRQLPWLALEPPPAHYGLGLAPLNEGGWWQIAGFFLTVAILLWWLRMYRFPPS